MRRLGKILLGIAGAVAVLVLGVFVYVQLRWDRTYDVPYPDLKASTDPAVIAKGKYLVHGPAHCSNCHVESVDAMKRAEAGEDMPLEGGIVFPMGPLGKLSPPNLTPDPKTGIGRYEDGPIFRMLRHAIKPDGTASLALMMPFWNMADDDLVAIVSYLRSLQPIHHPTPAPEWTFMGKAIRTFAPPFQPILDPNPPAKAPPQEPTKERGEYLARYVANCFACHTKHDEATFEQVGKDFAGGMEFEPMPEFGDDPNTWIRSPNLTPYKGGVLKKLGTLERWIERFRAGRAIPQSPMHWGPFGRMTDTDLEALWVFLNSLEPVDHDPGPVVFTKEGS